MGKVSNQGQWANTGVCRYNRTIYEGEQDGETAEPGSQGIAPPGSVREISLKSGASLARLSRPHYNRTYELSGLG